MDANRKVGPLALVMHSFVRGSGVRERGREERKDIVDSSSKFRRISSSQSCAEHAGSGAKKES
jgi:hypothetical protein